ncbi:hypothetical protein Tco_0918438 [Tanacetum coccineum]
MTDFAPGRAVTDVAHRKRGKYMDKCAAIGYGFLPFSFSSLGELETDAVTLLKWIQKFSMTQDIGTRAAIHIFNRISVAIAKEVVAEIAWYLDDGNIIGDTLVVGEVLKLLIEDGPHRGLHLNVHKTEDQHSFYAALCSAIERIITAFGLGFGDWQWRFSTLPFAFYGLGVYSAAGKEVDIGLGGGRDKPIRPADMLMYSWDGVTPLKSDSSGR